MKLLKKKIKVDGKKLEKPKVPKVIVPPIKVGKPVKEPKMNTNINNADGAPRVVYSVDEQNFILGKCNPSKVENFYKTKKGIANQLVTVDYLERVAKLLNKQFHNGQNVRNGEALWFHIRRQQKKGNAILLNVNIGTSPKIFNDQNQLISYQTSSGKPQLNGGVAAPRKKKVVAPIVNNKVDEEDDFEDELPNIPVKPATAPEIGGALKGANPPRAPRAKYQSPTVVSTQLQPQMSGTKTVVVLDSTGQTTKIQTNKSIEQIILALA